MNEDQARKARKQLLRELPDPGADHPRRRRGEAGDSGRAKIDRPGCGGARKCGYRVLGAGVAGDGRGGNRRGHDLRSTQCEHPGFESCRSRFSNRRQWPFPQTRKDGARGRALCQPWKRGTAQISITGHGGTSAIGRDTVRRGVRGSRTIPVTPAARPGQTRMWRSRRLNRRPQLKTYRRRGYLGLAHRHSHLTVSSLSRCVTFSVKQEPTQGHRRPE